VGSNPAVPTFKINSLRALIRRPFCFGDIFDSISRSFLIAPPRVCRSNTIRTARSRSLTSTNLSAPTKSRIRCLHQETSSSYTYSAIGQRQKFRREPCREPTSRTEYTHARTLSDRIIGSAILLRLPPPRFVYEDAPHQLRSQADEMGAVLPTHVRPVDQPHPCFVDQCSRLQNLTWPFLPQVMPHQAVQLGVNQRNQPL
jgi:hypothetical protein